MILSIPAPGVCVWLTGLSGSGKTTTARKVIEILPTPAGLLLDGDEIRATLSPGLGFTRADREINIARVAALARDAVDRRQIATLRAGTAGRRPRPDGAAIWRAAPGGLRTAGAVDQVAQGAHDDERDQDHGGYCKRYHSRRLRRPSPGTAAFDPRRAPRATT